MTIYFVQVSGEAHTYGLYYLAYAEDESASAKRLEPRKYYPTIEKALKALKDRKK